MTEQAQLDHAVINVGYEMDKAAEIFAGLGFTLTVRGYHSLGSINHLMMFGEDYLELIGLPAESAGASPGRPDIASAPYGLNGLVFKTSDAADTAAYLAKIDMSTTAPKSFTRPVKLAEGDVDASFTTAHVTEGRFAGGRVYFCQHHTPDVVWRREWQEHANGVTAITEFVIVSEKAADEAADVARLLRTTAQSGAGGFHIPLMHAKISVLSPTAYAARYGALACPMENRPSIFGALQVQTNDLEKIRNILKSPNNKLEFEDKGARLIVREPVFNALFEFVA